MSVWQHLLEILQPESEWLRKVSEQIIRREWVRWEDESAGPATPPPPPTYPPEPIHFMCSSGTLVVAEPRDFDDAEGHANPASPRRRNQEVNEDIVSVDRLKRGRWTARFEVVKPYDDKIGAIVLSPFGEDVYASACWEEVDNVLIKTTDQLCFRAPEPFRQTVDTLTFAQAAGPVQARAVQTDGAGAMVPAAVGVLCRTGFGPGEYILESTVDDANPEVIVGLRVVFIDHEIQERRKAQLKAHNIPDSYNVDVQFAVACDCHREGKVAEALRWFSRAAEQGHVKARRNAGIGLLEGWNGRKDLPRAARYLISAADENDSIAIKLTTPPFSHLWTDDREVLEELHSRSGGGYGVAPAVMPPPRNVVAVGDRRAPSPAAANPPQVDGALQQPGAAVPAPENGLAACGNPRGRLLEKSSTVEPFPSPWDRRVGDVEHDDLGRTHVVVEELIEEVVDGTTVQRAARGWRQALLGHHRLGESAETRHMTIAPGKPR